MNSLDTSRLVHRQNRIIKTRLRRHEDAEQIQALESGNNMGWRVTEMWHIVLIRSLSEAKYRFDRCANPTPINYALRPAYPLAGHRDYRRLHPLAEGREERYLPIKPISKMRVSLHHYQVIPTRRFRRIGRPRADLSPDDTCRVFHPGSTIQSSCVPKALMEGFGTRSFVIHKNLSYPCSHLTGKKT